MHEMERSATGWVHKRVWTMVTSRTIGREMSHPVLEARPVEELLWRDRPSIFQVSERPVLISVQPDCQPDGLPQRFRAG